MWLFKVILRFKEKLFCLIYKSEIPHCDLLPPAGVNESPLMTWGEIEGTPFRLDGSDTPVHTTLQGPSFRIPEPPTREKLALALAEKAGERHRDRKLKAIEAARKQLAT
jgi:protein DGCR14